MKKQSNLSRLLDYAGTYRILTDLSWVLAAAGALLALVPFGYTWRIATAISCSTMWGLPRVIERFKNKYPIWKMCELFEVSRSGFYKWRKRAASQQRSELDQIIIECQVLAKQIHGYRRVWLWMKQNTGEQVQQLVDEYIRAY